MDPKEHTVRHPADDPELKLPNSAGDEEDEGDVPPDTKSGREIERG